MNFPLKHVDESFFEEGVGFDGSSIRGFTEINESDLVALPDPKTLIVDPIRSHDEKKTAMVLADVYYPGLSKRLEKDSRFVVDKIESNLLKRGCKAFLSPELEFFLFESFDISRIVTDTLSNFSYKPLIYSSETDVNKGFSSLAKDGYFNVPPFDRTFQFRRLLYEMLSFIGIEAIKSHHEVASTGQIEVNLKYGTPKLIADNVTYFKYIARNLGYKHGYLVTFMPKPIIGDNGSGMHIHISLWQDGINLFYDESDPYAELSEIGRYFIGGILEHAKALSAIVAPSINSYKRLVPGFEAPVYICWSKSNRSALIRVPYYKSRDRDGKRIEVRFPDPLTNPYLAFSAIIAAGVDGVEKRIEPPNPLDVDVYKLDESERREMGVEELPGSLKEALDYLESDYVLRKWLGSELIETYIEYKKIEWREFSTHVTLWEYLHYLYL